uniref:Uncharacterized protein n=1 Tax=Anguilla anguilla TaxID=7936 RepID=A0A0E9PS72_ANGAN
MESSQLFSTSPSLPVDWQVIANQVTRYQQSGTATFTRPEITSAPTSQLTSIKSLISRW